MESTTSIRNGRPRILIAEGDADGARRLAESLGEGYAARSSLAGSEVLRWLEEGAADVLIVGSSLADMTSEELLAELQERASLPPLLLIDRGRNGASNGRGVFYVLPEQPPPADLRALVDGALGRRGDPATPSAPPRSREEAANLDRVLSLTSRLALQSDLRGAEGVAIAAVKDLCGADRAYCHSFDAASAELRSERSADGGAAARRSAAFGLTGFAARTGRVVCTDLVRADPRYRAALDDPLGDGDERMLVQPVTTAAGEVHAVLVAVREGRRPAFSAEERLALQSLAEHSAPLLQQLALHTEARNRLTGTSAIRDEAREELFRREAVEAMATRGKHGDVIRIAPVWVAWTYWLVLGLLVAALAYVLLGRVSQYSAGPAVVRAVGRTELLARTAGTVSEIMVGPGQSVAEGQLLLRFQDGFAPAAFERATRELEAQLRNLMLDPQDEDTVQAVRELRERRDAARAALEELEVRAPRGGRIGEVRVAPNQHVLAGEALLSLAGEDAGFEVVAFLPGGDRPRLAAGMEMRLELASYAYAYQAVRVDSVDVEVIGPEQAQRALGSQLAGAVPIRGPVVLVRAHLPTGTFAADGKEFAYFDGMAATAEVEVDSERILTAVLPALKQVLER